MQRPRAIAKLLTGRAASGFSPDWAGWLKTAGDRLALWFALEMARRRLFNWMPVGMALGVLLYFTADGEPGLVAPLAGFGLALAGAVLSVRHPGIRALAIAMACVFAGFAAGVWRTASVQAPVLERQRIGALSGFVETVEIRGNGARLVIMPTSFADMAPEKLPGRVRVTSRSTSVQPGDHVTGTARLLPPPEPARPGGYDFARDAFFRGVGAVGSFSGQLKLSPAPMSPPAMLVLNAGIDRARNSLTSRIANMVGGQAGAVAAALVTGKRGLISETTNDALRAAGIYHVVSISGLHMVLAAGTIFWLVRALLSLSVTIALSWPVKKIAAAVGMLGATGYCIFSGSDVATERSLIMTLVMMGAILVDRPALSMRNLAISAMIVLLREPETMLGPSFQMSFGAVAALIAWAERERDKSRKAPPPNGLAARGWQMVKFAIIGDLVTTLLATVATAPFGIYHFQTVNPYGLVGNALALPFISLVVMPAAVAGVLLYPFGLDGIAWMAMGWATVPVLGMSAAIAAHAGSTMMVPAFSPLALMLLALALVWATLWTTPLRFAAVLPLAAGLMISSSPQRVDGFIDRGGAGAALRGPDGRLTVIGRPSSFTLAQWLAADGDARKTGDPSLRAAAHCDPQGCVVDLGEKGTVSFVQTRRALAEDCARASLVITPLYWRSNCAAMLVDRNRLEAGGAATLSWNAQGWEIRGARQKADMAGSSRPWQPQRRPYAQSQPNPASPVAAAETPDAAATGILADMPQEPQDDLRDQ